MKSKIMFILLAIAITAFAGCGATTIGQATSINVKQNQAGNYWYYVENTTCSTTADQLEHNLMLSYYYRFSLNESMNITVGIETDNLIQKICFKKSTYQLISCGALTSSSYTRSFPPADYIIEIIPDADGAPDEAETHKLWLISSYGAADYVNKNNGESCFLQSQCTSNHCVHDICRAEITYCGDTFCDSGESNTCYADCGIPDEGACTSNSECRNKHCVHNICRASAAYCGDNFCDAGETIAICARDCEIGGDKSPGNITLTFGNNMWIQKAQFIVGTSRTNMYDAVNWTQVNSVRFYYANKNLEVSFNGNQSYLMSSGPALNSTVESFLGTFGITGIQFSGFNLMQGKILGNGTTENRTLDVTMTGNETKGYLETKEGFYGNSTTVQMVKPLEDTYQLYVGFMSNASFSPQYTSNTTQYYLWDSAPATLQVNNVTPTIGAGISIDLTTILIIVAIVVVIIVIILIIYFVKIRKKPKFALSG